MSRFRGKLTGLRGVTVTRLGGTGTGVTVEANGWESGVRVRAEVNKEGEDQFTITATTGSAPNEKSVIYVVITASEIAKLIGRRK